MAEDDYINKDGSINVQKLIGRGYNRFWNSTETYVAIKGSRGSKKSKTAALKIIFDLILHPTASALCIRQVAETCRDSVWSDLRWATRKFHVEKDWKFTKTPLEATHVGTGQKILFRGMDDPLKITSISVDVGAGICFVWFEECYQIVNYESVEMVLFSIRGELPGPGDKNYDPTLKRRFYFTFNPWTADHWLKQKFFDLDGTYRPEDVLAMTTTYKCNEHLSEADVKRYEDLYVSNPRRAKVVCDGEWGVSEGLVYDNWEMTDWFDPVQMLNENPRLKPIFGLDFGFAVSFTGFVAALVDVDARKVWIFDEIYERGLVNMEIAKRITEKGYGRETIIADSAEPKSIYDLQQGIIEEFVNPDGTCEYARWALPNITGIHKTSVEFGISLVQSYKMYIHPRCESVMYELHNYVFETDKTGRYTGKPIKDFDHCLVAGTRVWTEFGETPVENVPVGCMVMTHLGWRRVYGSGMTQPDAEIWEMETEDGRVIRGTANHPVVTTRGMTYLAQLKEGDEVLVADTSGASHPGRRVPDRCRGAVRHAPYGVPEGLSDCERYCLSQYMAEEGDEVPRGGALRTVGRWGLTTRMEYVRAVTSEGVLPAESPVSAPVRVTRVRDTGLHAPVFDLSVEEAHDFFAEGVLVGNCLDALRYALTTASLYGHASLHRARNPNARADAGSIPLPAPEVRPALPPGLASVSKTVTEQRSGPVSDEEPAQASDGPVPTGVTVQPPEPSSGYVSGAVRQMDGPSVLPVKRRTRVFGPSSHHAGADLSDVQGFRSRRV